MDKEQKKNDHSSDEIIKKYSPILYRIHSDQRKQTNIVLKIIEQDFIPTELYSEFKRLKEIPIWNQMREEVFRIVEEEFLQTIIEKGLKKEAHKQIIQNNHDDYIRFFQRKIRYLVTELEFDVRFDEYTSTFNDDLLSEILLNIETEKEKLLEKQAVSDFVLRVNDQISLSFIKFFSRKIAVFLTSKEPYRKLILDYFTEFFHYLVVY